MGNLDKALLENTKSPNTKTSTNNLDIALKENQPNGNSNYPQRSGTISPIDLNSKYDTEIGSGHNIDDITENRALKQGILDKWTNGITKAAGIAGTSILENTGGLLYGIVNAAVEGDISKLYNNKFTQSLDQFNNWVATNMPNYHTKAEQDYNLGQKLLTSNFWSDQFLNGAAYMGAAIVTGSGLNEYASLAKLARVGKTIDETRLATEGAKYLNEVSRGIKIADAVDFGKNAVLMSHGESAQEARQTYNDTKAQLIKDYTTKFGVEPNKQALKDIEKNATAAGNWGYATNLAITGTTNALLFPKILSEGYGANKIKLNNIELQGGKFIAEQEGLKSGISKEFLKGALEEGGQELGQLLTQKTLTDYYGRAYKDKKDQHSLVESLMKGLEYTLGSEEGLENFFLGALMGAPAAGIQARGEINEQNNNSNKVAELLNNPKIKQTVNSFDNFVRANSYEKDKNEALLTGSKFDYLNAEFNQNKSTIKDFIDRGAKDLIVQQFQDMKTMPEEEFKKVAGYPLDEKLPKSQLEIVDNAVKLVETLDKTNNSIKELFPYNKEKHLNPDNYKTLTDNLWHYSTSIDNLNKRIKDLHNNIYQIAAEKSVDISGTGETNNPFTINGNPLVAQQVNQINSDLQVAKFYRDKLVESYNLLSDPKTQNKALEDIKNTTIVDNTIDNQNALKTNKNSQESNSSEEVVPKEVKSDNTLIDEQLKNLDKAETNDLENISDEEAYQAIQDHYQTKREELLAKKQDISKIDDFTTRIANGEKLTSPEDLQFYDNNKEVIENKLSQLSKEDNSSINTNLEQTSQQVNNIDEGNFGLAGLEAQNPYKSTGGRDNDLKLSEQRYFRFLSNKDNIKEGTTLLVVTKENKPELYKELLDLDPTAKAYEESNPDYKGIQVIFVDKNDRLIKVNQDGTINPNGTIVFSTLLSPEGIDNTGIKDKEQAKKDLKEFRDKLLSEKGDIYLNITKVSNGVLVRQKNSDGSRKFNPIQGYITNNISTEGLLQLPTITSNDKGITTLKNNQTGLVGKLYAFDEDNNAIDLIPRVLTQSESLLVTNLLSQRLGIIEKTVESPSDELDKLILFGVPKEGANDYTLGIKGDNIFIGKQEFPIKDFANNQEAHNALNDLLSRKYINVNKNINFQDSFKEPILNEDHTISYKDWDSYQEYLLSNDSRLPLFGTDIPPLGEPRFRNHYVTYDPTIIRSDIKIDDSGVDNTNPESTNFNDLESKIQSLPNSDEVKFYIDHFLLNNPIIYTGEGVFATSSRPYDKEHVFSKNAIEKLPIKIFSQLADWYKRNGKLDKNYNTLLNILKEVFPQLTENQIKLKSNYAWAYNEAEFDAMDERNSEIESLMNQRIINSSELVEDIDSKLKKTDFKKYLNEAPFGDIKDYVKLEQPKSEDIFTKRGSGRKINLDRLESVLKSKPSELSTEERKWFKDQFPNIPVEEIKGLIDNNSFGRFVSNGKVLLSDLAPNNTLRHEAFHVVTQLYLTPKEIKDIYKETRSRLNNSKLSDLEVEEILAEDFANYKDSGSILGNRELTRNIFQKLLDFLKKLVGLSNTQIRDIYNKLETGNYLGKQIVGNNQFRTLDKSLPGKTEQFTKDTLDGVDYEFFNILFENGFTPEKLFQVANLSSKIYDEVYDSILDKYNLAKDLDNKQAQENFEYILRNWDNVVDLHNARIKSLGINLVKGENEKTGELDPNQELIEDPNLVTESSIVEDENKDQRSGEAFQNANTISTKDIMFKQTKLFIRTLPKVDFNGKPILNKLGLETLVDFNSTYNYLLKNLSGISNYPDMISKLKELSTKKPEFKILIDRLGESSDSLSYDQIIFQNQFRQDFDKNQAISYLTLMKADGTIYSIDATREFTSGKVEEIWRNNLKNSIELNDQGKYTLDPKVLTIKDNLEFLHNLGIDFSNETLPALINNEKYTNAVEGIKKYIKDNKNDITDLFSNKSDARGNLNTLLDLEAQFTPDVTELSFISTEGKTVYSISLNNYMSIIKNIINNVKTKDELFSKLPHLNTVYNQNSLWLKEMFKSNGDKRSDININLDLLDGFKTQDTDKKVAKKTTSLSAGDRLVMEINNLLNDGKTAVIRTSDKSTEFALSLSKYQGNSKLPVSIESLKNDFNNTKLKDIFRGYFKDELQAIFELKAFGKGENIDIYRTNRTKFGIFNDFPQSNTWKSEVNNKINDLIKLDLSNIEKQQIIDQLYNDLLPQIDNSTIGFFNDYFIDLKSTYEEYGITSESKLGISKELSNKYSFDQLIRSLAVNDFINSTEQIKLFIGDMSFYKDLFKRVAATTGTGKTARVDNDINSWLNTNITRLDGKKSDGKINVLVFEDSVQNSNYLPEYISNLAEQFKKDGLSGNEAISRAEDLLSNYNKMDEGDAQGWITLDEYREFFIRTGDWTAEKIINKALKGEVLNSDEIKYIMPIKAVYFGPQTYEGLYAPAYHKYSLMPLIPQLVKGKNLEALLDNMTKTQTGYAVFKSGSKVGTIVDENGKANKFYTNTNSGEINSKDLTQQQIDYRYLKIQLDIAPKLKKEVIFGTQFRKLVFSNLFENGKELFPGAEKLFNEYTKIFDDLIASNKADLIKELGINPENYKQEDIKKLVDLLKQAAIDRNLSDNIIDALQTEEINGNILLKYNFDSMVNKAKIDSMIMSLVNTRLIRQMMNGDAMIQGASSGFEPKGKRESNFDDKLKFYRKENGVTLPMQVKVPLTGEYQSLLVKYKDLEGVNKALKEGKIDGKLINLVGYRIPTQGLNSMEFMEIQEFLTPESGNLIILPTEIVAKSGGDFDIDKLNIFRPYFNPKNDIQVKQNRIIDIAREVLSHEYNFNALITPNSTHLLTNIVDGVRYIEYANKKIDNNEKPQSFKDYNDGKNSRLKNIKFTDQLKLTTKIDQFVKFLGGKAGVGIGALQNTHHILAQIANLSINKEYIDKFGISQFTNIFFPHNKTEDGNIDISKIKDVKGNNNISEVISQIINASVDIAKDPFMFDLNMNLDTLNTYSYLIRTGVEFKQIAYFMKQPIISEFLKEQSINKSIFLQASKSSKTEEAIVKSLIDKYEGLLQFKLKLDNNAFDEYMSDIKNRYDITIDELKGNLTKSNQNSVAYYHTQIQTLNNYIDYKNQAQMLSDAINSVNHDTAGLGSNINASRNKEEQKLNIEKSGFLRNNDNIYKNTFVGSFDQHKFTIDAYKQFYSTQKEDIVKNNKALLDKIVTPYTKQTDRNKLATLIENDFINYVVQNYGYKANISDLRDKLFKGKESVARELLELKTAKNDELKDNILIKALQPILANKDHNTDNIKIYSKRFDTFTSNQLTQSFNEINNINPKLGKDLMDLGILQSGLNNSAITYTGLIPFKYYGDLVKEAFNEFNKKNGAEDLAKFNDLFLRNNSKDSLVKRLFKKLGLSSLGEGMYGKNYDKELGNSSLEFKSTIEPIEEQDYLPEILDNSNDIVEDNDNFTKKGLLEERTFKLQQYIHQYYPEGKKIRFVNKEGEVDEGRIHTYLIDKWGKYTGFEINEEIVPLDRVLDENIKYYPGRDNTIDYKKQPDLVEYTPKQALKEAKYIHYNKEFGEYRSEIHNMALASKELKKIREEFPGQIESKIVNRQYRIKILEQDKIEFNTPTKQEFNFTEEEYNRYYDNIINSELVDSQKEDLISDLNKVESNKDLGKWLKKYCNL